MYASEHIDMEDPSKKKKLDSFESTPGLKECGWTKEDYENSLYTLKQERAVHFIYFSM